jgi:hypothetical protein
MAVMLRMDAVDPVFLAELGKHVELYEKAPMKIKRQIWAVDYDLFKAFIYPQLETFLSQAASPDAIVNEMWNRALEEPRQRRRNCAAITAMLTYLDKSHSLYKSFLDFCCRLFREDGNPLFCTLRADVLMGLHDNSVTELYQHDPYHELCWILDAATRDRAMSDALVRDLTGALEKLRGNKTKDKADRAMLLANPFVLHALLRSCCVALMRVVQEKVLPSDATRGVTLNLLVKLLIQGCGARMMLTKQAPSLAPKVAQREVLTVLCPWLAGVVVSGILEERGSLASAAVTSVPASVTSLLQSEPGARKLLQAFIAMRVESGEPHALDVLFAAGSIGLDGTQDLDFVQSLVTLTISGMRGSNSTTTKWLSTQQAVMQMLSAMSRLGIRCHLQGLRLLDAALPRLPVGTVINYLKVMVQNGAPADYTDKDIMLKYIAVIEHLVPDKVQDDEVQFVLDYLHLADEEQAEEQV